MSELQSTERLFSFLRELIDGKNEFPQRVLKLFSKYFNCNKALFFPYLADPIYKEPKIRHISLNNFIALNVTAQDMKAFTDYYYKKDIFSPDQLPPALQARDVLRIVDIMSLEEYERTEYYFYLNSVSLYYQACIFLKYKGRNIASVNLFRSRDMGDFTQEDADAFAYLSEFVSRFYVVALSNAPNLMLRSLFGKQFDGLEMGVVLLDSYMIALQANPAARRYSEQMISEMAGKNDFFQKSTRWTEAENSHVQMLLNYLGPKILADNEAISLLEQHFCFRSNSFTASDIMGSLRNYHMLFIYRGSEADNGEPMQPVNALTRRESEVLNLVLQGYDNPYIADQLGMSIYTVRTHISNIYKKFGVNNKISLLLALKKG